MLTDELRDRHTNGWTANDVPYIKCWFRNMGSDVSTHTYFFLNICVYFTGHKLISNYIKLLVSVIHQKGIVAPHNALREIRERYAMLSSHNARRRALCDANVMGCYKAWPLQNRSVSLCRNSLLLNTRQIK